MSTENKKSVAIYFILWILAVVVTVAVAFLLYSEDIRNAKFYLSLIMLLVAETVLFLYPACLTARNKSTREALPHYMGTYIIMSLYGFAVFVLVILAHTSISFNWLLSLHLILFLAFIVLFGSTIIGGMFITGVDAKDKREREPFLFFKNQFAHVCNRLAMIDQNEVQRLCQSFDYFRDEKLEYATSENLPGSEDIQLEMNYCLQNIEDKIANLEEIAAAKDKEESTSSPDSNAQVDSQIQKITKDLNNELKKMTLTLDRREQIMGQLR